MTGKRPDASEYHPRYTRYIDLVSEIDLIDAMLRQSDVTRSFLAELPEALHDRRYAPGKWTLRDVVGHIVDTERIFGFRLLAFARGDTGDLRRADEVLYVQNADFGRCSLSALVEEFVLVRQSHVMLLRHLPAAAWDRVGSIGNVPISVRAIAYMMLGHERHHLEVLRTRYLEA